MFNLPGTHKKWTLKIPQIMGILNATPDSFYAASREQSEKDALEKVALMIEQGASIIDIGGQSSRPGASLATEKEEIERITPIIKAINKEFPEILISVDTFHNSVAKEALNVGANIINDISGSRFDPLIIDTVISHNAGYIGMHSTGNFESMHQIEQRASITNSLLDFFSEMKKNLATKGLTNWVIDPGFGFGKTITENFTIVKELQQLTSLQLPILLGVSRKSSIYKTLGITPEAALNGTTILNTVGLLNGASIIRVHDVKEAKEILDLLPYLR